MPKPIMIKVESDWIYPWDGFEKLVALVDEFKEYQDPTWEGDWDSGDNIKLYGLRPENEQEKKKRLDAGRKEKLRKMEIKVKKEKEERDQLATLLLKYHGVLPEELNEWPT